MIFSEKKPLIIGMFISCCYRKITVLLSQFQTTLFRPILVSYYRTFVYRGTVLKMALLLLLLFLQSGLFIGNEAVAESTSPLMKKTESANAGKKEDFLFGKPKEFLELHTGIFFPQADSGVFDMITSELTLEKSDFRAWDFGADAGFNLHKKVDLVFHIDTSSSSADSEFKDFVDQEGLPITQKTTLLETSLTAGIKYSLRSPGRQLGEYAFLPTRVVPFIEGGAGFIYYDFDQKGYFVDNATSEIFYAILNSSDWTEVVYLGVGTDIYLKWRTYLTLDLRYSWASDGMNKDFIGFDDINLSGLRVITGIKWCFF